MIDLRFADSLIGIAGAVLGFWGGWQLTEPDPSTDGRMERIARVSSVIYEWLLSPD